MFTINLEDGRYQASNIYWSKTFFEEKIILKDIYRFTPLPGQDSRIRIHYFLVSLNYYFFLCFRNNEGICRKQIIFKLEKYLQNY